jgi:hypothetical protein
MHIRSLAQIVQYNMANGWVIILIRQCSKN